MSFDAVKLKTLDCGNKKNNFKLGAVSFYLC